MLAPGSPLAGLTIVHCPLSHRYFRHHEFPAARLRQLGVNLCVATDSPASDGSFSLLEELRAFAASQPDFSAAELLGMVTLNPAQALGLAGRLGCIRPGAWADLVAFPDEFYRRRRQYLCRCRAMPGACRMDDGAWECPRK